MDTCSLDPTDQEMRFAEFGELAKAGLLDADRTPDGARLRLRDSEEVRARLWPLIEAERRCCSFLEFDVEVGDDDLLVEVGGPPTARHLIDRLFELDPAGGRR
jgi:hypothetical protein